MERGKSTVTVLDRNDHQTVLTESTTNAVATPYFVDKTYNPAYIHHDNCIQGNRSMKR